MRFVRVTFSNGETYQIPRAEIADNKACEYHDRGTAEFDEMFEETMAEDEDVIDWARNNMNWSDLEHYATRINEPALVDYDEEWPNCKVMCVDA